MIQSPGAVSIRMAPTAKNLALMPCVEILPSLLMTTDPQVPVTAVPNIRRSPPTAAGIAIRLNLLIGFRAR
jgi:hypothetical protein